MIEMIKEEHVYLAMKEVLDVNRADVDFNKTWIEHGCDELDNVEVVMWFECYLNISINDDIAMTYMGLDNKIYDLPGLKVKMRQTKLDAILP
jgi:acyl carrier protein